MKNYALDLDADDLKAQREIRRKIAAVTNGKPMTLAVIREKAALSYEELSLAIDATERTSAFRYAIGTRRPTYEHAVHIAKVLRGATSVDLLMAPGRGGK